jgi:hypothetical protein
MAVIQTEAGWPLGATGAIFLEVSKPTILARVPPSILARSSAGTSNNGCSSSNSVCVKANALSG